VVTVAGIGALIAAVVATWLLAGRPTPTDRPDGPAAAPAAPRFASTGEAREPEAEPTPSPAASSVAPPATAAPPGAGPASTVGGGSTTNPAPPKPPTAPSPVSRTYRLGPNVLSAQLKDGTCVYRVIYGNYGSAAVAYVQFYGGACGATTVAVAAQRGNVRSYENTNAATNLTGGSDSCGSYLARQALSRTDQPAFAVGVRVRFAETGNTYTFLSDQGGSPPVYRSC